MTQVQGTTTDRFAGLAGVLEKSLASGADLGASIAIFHQGELVADLWGGFIDETKTTPWQRDTIVNVWSTTKTMTFLVALMLSDRGELDFNANVATYWPEFAANGKEDIEVRHLMNHCAGLSGWQEPIKAEELADWDLATSLLAAQKPWWDDRTKTGYHAVTQGFLIGEVVRRITGTTIGQFFKSEVADVLGADFFIGLPESEEGASQHRDPASAGRLRGRRARFHCGAHPDLSPGRRHDARTSMVACRGNPGRQRSRERPLGRHHPTDRGEQRTRERPPLLLGEDRRRQCSRLRSAAWTWCSGRTSTLASATVWRVPTYRLDHEAVTGVGTVARSSSWTRTPISRSPT